MKPPPIDNAITFVRPKLELPAFSLKWLIIVPLGIFLMVGIFSTYYTVSP